MIVIGNLKMYMTYEDVLNYVEKIDSDVVLCPTALFVPYFLNHKFAVGVQNIATNELGAYTGEISARQAKGLGVTYAIVGHSERRIYQRETDEEINAKVLQGLKNGLKVVLCIGEDKGEDRKQKLEYQLLNDLKGVDNFDNLIIAYEPIWCIGTGITPTNEEIEATIYFIQTILNKICKQSVKILYGGSVDKDNIKKLKNIENLSGFLIGKASTDCKQLTEIVDNL